MHLLQFENKIMRIWTCGWKLANAFLRSVFLSKTITDTQWSLFVSFHLIKGHAKTVYSLFTSKSETLWVRQCCYNQALDPGRVYTFITQRSTWKIRRLVLKISLLMQSKCFEIVVILSMKEMWIGDEYIT